MQVWIYDLAGRSAYCVLDTQVTNKACGPLVFMQFSQYSTFPDLLLIRNETNVIKFRILSQLDDIYLYSGMIKVFVLKEDQYCSFQFKPTRAEKSSKDKMFMIRLYMC